MEPNYRYLLEKALTLTRGAPGARVLDFGCGGGRLVSAGLDEELRIWGAEAFYEGSKARDEASERGLLGARIFETRDNRLPFRDAAFDLVVSNQVFEHIEALEACVAELHRVLKPGGSLVTLFPSKKVVREGHCGIPLVHWFSPDSSVRYPYALTMRCLEFGFHKRGWGKTRREWTRDKLRWLDEFVFYRKRRTLLELLGERFEVRPIEKDYMRFRLRASRIPMRATFEAAVRRLMSERFVTCVTNRMGGVALIMTKQDSKSNDALLPRVTYRPAERGPSSAPAPKPRGTATPGAGASPQPGVRLRP